MPVDGFRRDLALVTGGNPNYQSEDSLYLNGSILVMNKQRVLFIVAHLLTVDATSSKPVVDTTSFAESDRAPNIAAQRAPATSHVFVKTLGSMALMAAPIGGLFAGVALPLISLIASLFTRQPAIPTADDIYSQINARIGGQIEERLQNHHTEEMVKKQIRTIGSLETHLIASARTTNKRDYISALQKLDIFFTGIFTGDLYLPASFLNKEPPKFKLRLPGTNWCLGPRSDGNGLPSFHGDPAKDFWRHYDCSDSRFTPTISFAKSGTNIALTGSNAPSFCVYGGGWPVWYKYDGAQRFYFSMPCSDEGSSADKITFIESDDKKRIILTTTGPQRLKQSIDYDKGGAGYDETPSTSFVACNGAPMPANCPGGTAIPSSIEGAGDSACVWVSHYADPPIGADQNVFTKQDACFTAFEKVPVYDSIFTPGLEISLGMTPILLKHHLMTLIELAANTGQKEFYCSAFDDAIKKWSGSFKATTETYLLIRQGEQYDKAWITDVQKEVNEMLTQPHCEVVASKMIDLWKRQAKMQSAKKGIEGDRVEPNALRKGSQSNPARTETKRKDSQESAGEIRRTTGEEEPEQEAVIASQRNSASRRDNLVEEPRRPAQSQTETVKEKGLKAQPHQEETEEEQEEYTLEAI